METNSSNKILPIDKATFDQLFMKYYKQLCQFAFVFLKSKDDSEEVVQTVFVRFWESRKKLSAVEQFKSYLFKSVYHECLHLIKNKAIRENNNQTYHQYLEEESDNSKELDQVIPFIFKAIDQLPEKCRQIFVLNKLEGLTQKEIADVLNISIKTVENQMTIALQKLRHELKPILHLLPALIFWKFL